LDSAKLFVALKPNNDYDLSKVVGMFKGITSKFGANIRNFFYFYQKNIYRVHLTTLRALPFKL